MSVDYVVPETFRAFVESAEKKFARVRDVQAYRRGSNNHYFHKVFKAYTRLWKYQQENRQKLVDSGLQRWEIGEIVSRIRQLYFGQYIRTSEARFLLESYIFYEAILNRGYFGGFVKDRMNIRVFWEEGDEGWVTHFIPHVTRTWGVPLTFWTECQTVDKSGTRS